MLLPPGVEGRLFAYLSWKQLLVALENVLQEVAALA